MQELMKKIGLKTQGDLQRFKQEEQKPEEKLQDALFRYLMELGTDFRIKEEQ